MLQMYFVFVREYKILRVSVLDVKLSNISVQDIYAASWDCEDVWAVSSQQGEMITNSWEAKLRLAD